MPRKPSPPSSSCPVRPRRRGGFLLPITLIALTVGTLVLAPLAGMVGLVGHRAGGGLQEDLARLTAESALYRVAVDLALGRPVGEPGYSPPTLTLNGVTVRVEVERAPGPGPTPEPVFTPLAQGTLAPGAFASRTLPGVEPFTPLQAQALARPAERLRLQVYAGPGAVGAPLAEAEGEGQALLTLPPERVQGGTYTLVVWNEGTRSVTLAPFSSGGAGTWVLTTAREDFLVTARAGQVALTVLLRRVPGPQPDRWAVQGLAWRD